MSTAPVPPISRAAPPARSSSTAAWIRLRGGQPAEEDLPAAEHAAPSSARRRGGRGGGGKLMAAGGGGGLVAGGGGQGAGVAGAVRGGGRAGKRVAKDRSHYIDANGVYKSPERSATHRFVQWFVETSAFSSFIMTVIVVNTIFIAIETSRSLSQSRAEMFQTADLTFLGIYTLEFALKLYAEPRGYWLNNYNRFDFAILVFSYVQFLDTFFSVFSVFGQVTFLRVLRALRALRALRGVSFIRGLQVILVALLKTLAGIVNLISLLLLIMYVFAIMAFYLFGPRDPLYWGSLGRAYFSLFTFVTADGWTDIQGRLDEISMSTRIFTVLFIFIGHFIFTNLFIGVVIQNLEEATDEDKRIQIAKKKKLFAHKKKLIMATQEKDLTRLVQSKESDGVNLQEFFGQMAGKLRHDDLVPMTTLMCDVTWLETYLVTMFHQENAMYRAQQLHFEVANTLSEMMERRLSEFEGVAPAV